MLKDLISLATAKAKLAALVVGALAVGGMAASVGTTSFLPVDSSTDVTVSPSPTEAPDAEDTASPSDAPEASSEASPDVKPTDSVTPAPCPTDVKNHGAYVSSVAKDHSTTGREHGQAVSAAAHSDCGKAADSTDATDATDSTDGATEAPEPTDAPESDAPDGHSGAPHHAKKAKHSHHHG